MLNPNPSPRKPDRSKPLGLAAALGALHAAVQYLSARQNAIDSRSEQLEEWARQVDRWIQNEARAAFGEIQSIKALAQKVLDELGKYGPPDSGEEWKDG